jgi:prolyl-tRNA synthetase
MGAIIEASHDQNGIIWPESVAPFRVGLVNMRADDGNVTSAADELYAKLGDAAVETLYDDRDERGGAKFATMDVIGLPWQLIVGPKGLEKGVVELKQRATGERQELSVESALARLTS